MQIRDSRSRFGTVSVALHWLVALAVIAMVALGLYMTDLPRGLERGQWVGVHKSLGLLVLALGLIRLLWRVTNPRPEAGAVRPWEPALARVLQGLLLALVVLLPLSGWVMSSFGGHAVSFFGLATLPALPRQGKAVVEVWQDIHATLAWSLVAVLAVHALAALKHHFLDRDATLLNMLGRGRAD